MALNLIVCMDRNRGIGKDGSMPWHLPNELEYFKKTTLNKNILMGRKTYESIGRLLPKRHSMILTSNKDFYVHGASMWYDVQDVLYFQRLHGYDIFVIGGAKVYEQFLPYADKLYITRINAEFNCDTFFPIVNMNDWNTTPLAYWSDTDSGYDLNYSIYERKPKKE